MSEFTKNEIINILKKCCEYEKDGYPNEYDYIKTQNVLFALIDEPIVECFVYLKILILSQHKYTYLYKEQISRCMVKLTYGHPEYYDECVDLIIQALQQEPIQIRNPDFDFGHPIEYEENNAIHDLLLSLSSIHSFNDVRIIKIAYDILCNDKHYLLSRIKSYGLIYRQGNYNEASWHDVPIPLLMTEFAGASVTLPGDKDYKDMNKLEKVLNNINDFNNYIQWNDVYGVVKKHIPNAVYFNPLKND